MTTWGATLLALLLWGLWGLISKISATAGRPPTQVLLFETVGHVAGVLVAIAVLGVGQMKFDRTVWAPLATGFIGAIAMLLFIMALRLGSTAVVVPVTGLYPAITVLLAYFFLHEGMDLRTMAGVACAMLATLLLSK